MALKIVGNGKTATVLILLFIVLLIVLASRCAHAAEIDLNTGVAFGPSQAGPVLGLDIRFPQTNDVDLFAGTTLWGQTSQAETNWDWHAGFRTCRWSFCASIGAAYLQRTDAIDGSHTNYFLGLSYLFGGRVAGIGLSHLSNAGTTQVNKGRDAAIVTWRLQ